MRLTSWRRCKHSAATNACEKGLARALWNFAGNISIGRRTPAASLDFTIGFWPREKSNRMRQTSRFQNNPAAVAALVARFSKENREAGTSYATVRDYCERVDLLPEIAPTDRELKNMHGPW